MESDPFIYRGVLSSVYFLFVLVLAPASLLEPAADLSASKAKLLPNLPKKDLVQVKTLQILRDLSPPPPYRKITFWYRRASPKVINGATII